MPKNLHLNKLQSNDSSTIFRGSFTTPLGKITVTTQGTKVLAIQFGKKAPEKSQGPPIYLRAQKQIGEYTRGNRRSFQFPFIMEGTPFQIKVWKALAKISFGQKKSYKDIAVQIKSPKAFRAVGNACRNNPLPLVIACHRVVGTGGKLTGFAGGMALKERLLALESKKILP